MPHGKPGAALVSRLGERAATTHRRAAALGAAVAGAAVVVVFWATLGLSVAGGAAALGTTGLVYAGSIELACRRFGHAVDCASGTFCECRRCGRPMEDG
ncbi:hypothetical protein [Natronomonas marina]|jgi:hypothetical protein|uniref:hypothetical protein n=1 Tax=Natronomonas marina TaxID=2961939 RepID=UPI0020CA1B0F|nr:hypothetical protein [Natronomonas marina]